jgi:hypothetical protein
MMVETAEKLLDLSDRFWVLGYTVTARPIAGQEELFLGELRCAFQALVEQYDDNAKRYGFNKRSKRALTCLHSQIPSPCFGVEVSA